MSQEIRVGPWVCSHCQDTHQVHSEERGRSYNCLHCPTPCQACRSKPQGPYCATTPCACKCHGAVTPPLRRITLSLAADTTATECGQCQFLDPPWPKCEVFGDYLQADPVTLEYQRVAECLAAEVR